MIYSNHIIYKALDDQSLNSIKEVLLNITEEKWICGLNSTGHNNLNVKNNKEFKSTSDEHQFLIDIVYRNINSVNSFIDFTVPYTNSNILFSKTEKGGFYKMHVDDLTSGEFSTTIFLNEKESYEGGELSLILNDSEVKIKLDPGYAVTYHTGTPHFVNEVKSGTRYAAVFWTFSMFRDPLYRFIYSEIKSMGRLVPISDNEFIMSSVEDYKNSYHFRKKALENFLVKNFSRKKNIT